MLLDMRWRFADCKSRKFDSGNGPNSNLVVTTIKELAHRVELLPNLIRVEE